LNSSRQSADGALIGSDTGVTGFGGVTVGVTVPLQVPSTITCTQATVGVADSALKTSLTLLRPAYR
jgi:hypothetical protein